MKEVWKDIEGYVGKYQVSNLGRVKRLAHSISCDNQWRCHVRNYKEKILKLCNDKDGYLLVSLGKDGKRITKKVHRLVCEAFLDNPNGYGQINHKNKNKKDNRVENLEWCNHTQNQVHRFKYKGKPRGVTKTVSNTYQASISIDGREIYIGRYKTIDEAYEAWFNRYVELRGEEPW
jgi:hypothetical protein